MLLGMLKDIGLRLVGDQKRALRKDDDGLAFLPQDVADHMLVEGKRVGGRAQHCAPARARRVSVLV